MFGRKCFVKNNSIKLVLNRTCDHDIADHNFQTTGLIRSESCVLTDWLHGDC